MLTNFFSNPLGALISLLYALPAVLVALSFHEFAHAFMAVKMGDNTPKFQGRLTLSPFRHLDPIGFIALLLLGFGWAKPVYITPRNFHNYRKGNILVSIAGIVMNFMVAFVAMFIFVLGQRLNIAGEVFNNILIYMAVINLSLMFFNIMPVPPLDGYNFFKNILGFKASRFFTFVERYGFIILIGLMIAGVFRAILTPLVGFVENGLYQLFVLILF